MIRHTFYIWEHSWTFRAYFAINGYWANEILGHLWRIGADMDVMRSANKNLRSGQLNTGLTYTSRANRETVMVVALASSGAEFFNSFCHELKHAEEHIGDVIGIDPKSEQAAYFRGGLAREMYPHVRHLLCDCCRRKLRQ